MNVLASEVPSWLVAGVAFAFGAAWGSFFNVAIHRWPRDMSVVHPPSHCPHCHARIPARFNLPILSYFLLRGRTACCGQPLSPRYPMVETLGAVLCVALAHRHVVAAPEGTSLVSAALTALCYFAFAGGLLIATFVDLAWMEIPDEVSLPGAALGIATAVWRAPPGIESAALGAGGGFLLIQFLFVYGYERLTGRRGMGEGDSKLVMMIGAFLGWQGALFSLFAGAAQGLVVAVVNLVRGVPLAPEPPALDAPDAGATGSDVPDADPATSDAPDAASDPAPADSDPPARWVGHAKLPFGPFLALAALEYLFFGPALTDAWFRLVDAALHAGG
jgi:leader peptidase (prepilin peptidase)/N-methyltransferase